MLEKILISVLLILGIYYLMQDVVNYWDYTIHLFSTHKITLITLILLFVVFGLVNKKTINTRIIWMNTYVHESYHMIVAFLTGGRLVSMNVNPDFTGRVTHSSRYFSALISLAPYALPFIPLLLYGVWHIASGNLKQYLFIAFNISYAAYLFRVFREARSYQSDLQKTGIIWSWVIIILSNVYFWLLFGK